MSEQSPRLDILARVFSEEGMLGSLQALHIFGNEREANLAFTDDCVRDEIDHSYAFLGEDGRWRVRWRNSAGEVMFCGSGAYALACYLCQDGYVGSLELAGVGVVMGVEADRTGVSLCFAGKSLTARKKGHNMHTYRAQETGVYYVDCYSLDEIRSPLDPISYCERAKLEDPHGLCLFHWSEAEGRGYYRYFTPWHGREEDTVTGSIQAYLTPFVHRKGVKGSQDWVQLSNSSGFMSTSFSNGLVCLRGHFEIVDRS